MKSYKFKAKDYFELSIHYDSEVKVLKALEEESRQSFERCQELVSAIQKQNEVVQKLRKRLLRMNNFLRRKHAS